MAALDWYGAVALATLGGTLLGLWLAARRRRRVARLLGDSEVVRRLVGTDLSSDPWRSITLIALAAGLLAAALLDPTLTTPAGRPGGPVVLLLDASGSMLAADDGRSRLDVQREMAFALSSGLPDIAIGIVAFAGRAFSLTPPTRDHTSVRMYLEALGPTTVTQNGSALGAAIRQGVGLLVADDDRSGGTLVLISDGDETEDVDAALGAADLAARSGAVVHVIGVGSDRGAEIPALDPATGESVGRMRGPDGSVLVSARSDALLEAIARRGGGRYLRAERETVPESVVAEVLAADDRSGDDGGMPPYRRLAALGFVLLLIEPLIRRPPA